MLRCPPMRRLARRLLTICSAASLLLLCVAACTVLCVRAAHGQPTSLVKAAAFAAGIASWVP